MPPSKIAFVGQRSQIRETLISSYKFCTDFKKIENFTSYPPYGPSILSDKNVKIAQFDFRSPKC